MANFVNAAKLNEPNGFGFSRELRKAPFLFRMVTPIPGPAFIAKRRKTTALMRAPKRYGLESVAKQDEDDKDHDQILSDIFASTPPNL